MAQSVESLMKQYILNKDSSKQLKSERQFYMSIHKCEGEDCVRDGTEEVDFCDVCKVRHKYYLVLKQLSAANSGIMNTVRSIVKKLNKVQDVQVSDTTMLNKD